MRYVARIPSVALLFLLTLGTGLHAQQVESGEKIYQRGLKSTVWVVVPLEQVSRAGGGTTIHVATGTGSLVSLKKRLVLTNYHVVGNKDAAVVYFPIYVKNGEVVSERKIYTSGKTGIPGKVVARDSKKDLALIQLEVVPKGAQEVVLAAKSPSPGQRLHSIGNPGASGALWSYTQGTVRQVYTKKWRIRGDDAFDIDAKIVETQSPINQGDSGGPVLNDRGELVAVTQGHVNDDQARLVSIFIDVSEVRALLHSKGVVKIPETQAVIEQPVTETTPAKSTTTTDDDKTKAEKEATHKLKLAKMLLADGLQDKARTRLKEVVDAYPKTKAAEEAKELLKNLK
jgi:S1-C subfamily serine protease